MCGRFNLRITAADLKSLFGTTEQGIRSNPQEFDSCLTRFNIAPTQKSIVCHLGESDTPVLTPMRWGLIPSWAKDLRIGAKMINARSETVAEKPSFRSAFKRRRCLVPASGFYEWKRSGKEKQPFHIHQTDDSPFAMAGLWELLKQSGGPDRDEPAEILSFTILTAAANSFMSPIHDRMPVILSGESAAVWLDHEVEASALSELIQPFEWENFEAVPISSTVNNARNETPECLAPLS
ncbi:putative SOS response-associated peptidase YedK [Thalassoglobus neptunius]|uniref:Abasic site processing protein n=1 Tax=Thalassoglobus neptunius TaxID=1938619 RepID=A0A5C5X0S2_9PLAN|nr:SOS response-associated peptidase [Thalassoglobus neptunius]TWT55765.1 putative SOS response-associated peptidase YedK [Thalassoglobus neptunius]